MWKGNQSAGGSGRNQLLKNALKNLSTKVDSGPPARYQLQLEENVLSGYMKTRKCTFSKNDVENVCAVGRLERTVILLGATGAGKSALVNAIINHTAGVPYEDDFRLVLVDEPPAPNQAESVTDWITMYTIPALVGGRLPYTLNIIDTPGFGDTHGIERDKFLREQVHEFFKSTDDQGISTIDAVCLVTPAACARLTPTQSYIYDSIKAIFGKDIESNIFIMITFVESDSDPPALKAIREGALPDEHWFKFNNSSLFEDNTRSGGLSFGFLYWRMEMESLGEFFAALKQTSSRSLKLTKEVLAEREGLEVVIKGLQDRIRIGLSLLEGLGQEIVILKRHELDAEASKDFEYTVNEMCMERVKMKDGEYVTNCLICNVTCHELCRVTGDRDKFMCSAMDVKQEPELRTCRVCPKSCHWRDHVNNPYAIYWTPVQTKKTFAEVKKRHEEAQGCASTHAEIVQTCRQRFRKEQMAVQHLMKKAKNHIGRLHEIALKPSKVTFVNYIDMLLNSEKIHMDSGYERRIEMLESLKKFEELVQHVQGEDFQPWGDLLALFENTGRGQYLEGRVGE